MRFFLKSLVFLCLCLLPVFANAQNAGNNNPSMMSGKAQRAKAKKEAKEKREQEKLHDKQVKEYHKNVQTKKVRKRMKKDKRKATLNNDHKREFFMIRWFSRK